MKANAQLSPGCSSFRSSCKAASSSTATVELLLLLLPDNVAMGMHTEDLLVGT